MGRLVRGVADEHPQVSLGRGQRDRVPVDEHMAVARPHHVAGVRLAVGDDPVGAALRDLGGETIEQEEQFCHIGIMSRECFPCGLGEGSARPRLIQRLECRFEVATAGQTEVDGARHRGRDGCRRMDLGEHREYR
jgi:hypothetical protein